MVYIIHVNGNPALSPPLPRYLHDLPQGSHYCGRAATHRARNRANGRDVSLYIEEVAPLRIW